MRRKVRPELIAVHPDFKTMLKTKASLDNKTIIDTSEDMASEIEKVLRNRGLLQHREKDEDKKKPTTFFFDN